MLYSPTTDLHGRTLLLFKFIPNSVARSGGPRFGTKWRLIGTFWSFFGQKMRNVKKSGTFRSFLVLFRFLKKLGTFWDFLIWQLVHFKDFNLATLIPNHPPLVQKVVSWYTRYQTNEMVIDLNRVQAYWYAEVCETIHPLRQRSSQNNSACG